MSPENEIDRLCNIYFKYSGASYMILTIGPVKVSLQITLVGAPLATYSDIVDSKPIVGVLCILIF